MLHRSLRRRNGSAKATVTPDRTISGSYDWLRLGQGATDRQCLLRSPVAVACRDRSLRVVALSRTIGEYRWQEPSLGIVRLVVVINGRCTINRDGRRPMVRSIDCCILRPIVRAIVASCDRSYDHLWHPVTERTINRGTRRTMVRSIVGGNDRSIARSIVESCDRSYDQSYDQSWHQTIWNNNNNNNVFNSYRSTPRYIQCNIIYEKKKKFVQKRIQHGEW